MKLSCVSVMIPGKDYREKLDNLAYWGFEGIEVFFYADEEDVEERVKELQTALKSSPVKLAAVIYLHEDKKLSFGKDPKGRQKSLEVSKRGLDIAARLNSKLLWGPEYKAVDPPPLFEPYDPTYGGRRHLLIEQLKELALHAESIGTSLCLEPINRYESTFFHTLSEAIEICKDVGSDSISVMGDFFHLNIEEADITQSIVRSRSYLKHIHLGDSNRWLPGYGHTDFVAGFRALREIEYCGYMSIECGMHGPAEQELPKCVNYLKACITLANTEKGGQFHQPEMVEL